MKNILMTAVMLTSVTFSGLTMAADAAQIQDEIKGYEKSRTEAQAEIDQLKVKLEKATSAVNENETRVQEIEAKLSAAE